MSRSSHREQWCPVSFCSAKMRLFFKLFAVLAIMAALSATNVPSPVGVWGRTPRKAPPSPKSSPRRFYAKPPRPRPAPPPPAQKDRVRPLRSPPPPPPPSPYRQGGVRPTQPPAPPPPCH
ncbi:hypothetical protein D1007_34762 [Hordeum vulgare]|nr:hypothetical protein D1007_34762 [Hordeum vulgare]